MLKKAWLNIFQFNWRFGLFLVLSLGIPRFIIVLHANISRNYSLISVLFVFMFLAPFIFLTRDGRQKIGLRKPRNYYWLMLSLLMGILACSLMFVIAWYLYADSINNCFVYISKSYAVAGKAMNAADKKIYFLIYAIIGMTFSPIGEEIFYRGIVHESFVGKFGEQKASILDSTAFALTHLAHFGIVYTAGDWKFLFFPAILWVVFMFIASRLFFLCKQKTSSLLGAILAHAGFNLAMMYLIFYHIF